MLAFDIETGPLPLDQLQALLPPFDEAEVKLGNLKDPDKIKVKVEEARANHESDFVSRAALSPMTGRVLAIGYWSIDSAKYAIEDGGDGDDRETVMLTRFWKKYLQCRQAPRRMVGYNCHGFDIPFLIRRSWLLNIDVPSTVIDKWKWIDGTTFVDLMSRWSIGDQRGWVKLDMLGQAFGLGGKTEGVNGAMFHELWEKDREKACEYLRRDLELTAGLAVRMGVV